jgi:hypothetical protein
MFLLPLLIGLGMVGMLMGSSIGRVWAVNREWFPDEYRQRIRESFWWSVPFALVVLCAIVTDLQTVRHPVSLADYREDILLRVPFLWWFGWSVSKFHYK